MVQRGRSANEVIDKMYHTIGYKTSVTKILKKLQEDNNNPLQTVLLAMRLFPSDKIIIFLLIISIYTIAMLLCNFFMS